MPAAIPLNIDPKLDLVLEREIDVPVALVWKAWTTPEHLREWFVPKPWTIAGCEIDLRPGGIFKTVDGGTNWTPLTDYVTDPTLGSVSARPRGRRRLDTRRSSASTPVPTRSLPKWPRRSRCWQSRTTASRPRG